MTGLVKAQLIELKPDFKAEKPGGQKLSVQFNPENLKVTYSNENRGGDQPGGSSRQFVVVVEDGRVRARLLTPREAARLMGLPDEYRLPAATTAALKVAGDGVAVPVVRALAAQVLEPLLLADAAAAA